jgi:hypothetical protein
MFYDMKSVFDQLGFRVLPPEGASPFDGVQAAASRGKEAPAPEELPAWPEGLDEAFTADKVTEAAGQAAKAAGGTAGEADCERYPCIVVIDMPAKDYATGLSKATNVLEKVGVGTAWHWPVVKDDRYHAIMVFPAGPLDVGREPEARARMQAHVAALLEDAG